MDLSPEMLVLFKKDQILNVEGMVEQAFEYFEEIAVCNMISSCLSLVLMLYQLFHSSQLRYVTARFCLLWHSLSTLVPLRLMGGLVISSERPMCIFLSEWGLTQQLAISEDLKLPSTYVSRSSVG